MKYQYPILLLLLGCLISIRLSGQEKQPDFRKLHYLSQEEMDTPFDASRNFYETDPPEGKIRNVAEFDAMQAVLVRYPFGIPIELIREMAEETEVLTIVANANEELTVRGIYEDYNVDLSNCSFLHAASDSYWTRDYGPWFVFDGNKQPGIVNFPYNRPRPNDNNIPLRVAEYLDIDLYGMNLSHTGGNYMSDGMGMAASTDLVWEENDDLSHDEINTLVLDYLKIEEFDVRPDPLDDYIKHIDCWGKYLSPGKVIIGEVPTTDYRYQDYEDAANFFANTISSYGVAYEVVRVFSPGTYPYTPYTNSLILNKKVLVPITGSQWDDEALNVYEEAMPGYEIVGVMYDGWYNTDALHCRTKGIADIEMLYINHVPTLGTVGAQESYEISAEFMANSGASLYADSVLIYYSLNGGEYTTSTMSNDSADYWSGSITDAQAGDQVDYYLFAADQAGKRANHPFIGEADPHEFSVFGVQTDNLKLDPDTLAFLLPEDIMGLPLHIINTSNNTVEITHITDYSDEYGFAWWAEEIPVFPYMLVSNDTLTLTVYIAVPVTSPNEILQDTIFVETDAKTYSSLILFDEDLVDIDEQASSQLSHTIFPNPFTNQVRIRIDAPETAAVKLSFYNVNGKLVRNLTIQASTENMEFIWDGKDEKGKQLPNGYYFYKLQTGENSVSGKVLLTR